MRLHVAARLLSVSIRLQSQGCSSLLVPEFFPNLCLRFRHVCILRAPARVVKLFKINMFQWTIRAHRDEDTHFVLETNDQ